MSDYTVLARKYRPQNFEDMVGQKHVLSALSNALSTGRLHHAYLLTGTRGVGKTTIARILAKCFNCEHGITAHPCGECETCKAIADGTFPDLIEIDAASRTKVEDTRDLLDNVQYRPMQGRFKIYIIDEVHMLSNSSFNALLKTLEEPPAYVKFILATTDPQKLPVTVVSRCLQFRLKALTVEDIRGQLEHVLDLEHITYEHEGTTELARAARGSMRDALSLTDQAIALGNGEVTLKGVTNMIGTLDSTYIIELLNLIAENNSSNLMEVLKTVGSVTPDFDELHISLAKAFHDIALYQIASSDDDIYSLRNDIIAGFAKKFSPEELQLYYQIVLEGRRELPYSPDALASLMSGRSNSSENFVKNNSSVQNSTSSTVAANIQTSNVSASPKIPPQNSEVVKTLSINDYISEINTKYANLFGYIDAFSAKLNEYQVAYDKKKKQIQYQIEAGKSLRVQEKNNEQKALQLGREELIRNQQQMVHVSKPIAAVIGNSDASQTPVAVSVAGMQEKIAQSTGPVAPINAESPIEAKIPLPARPLVTNPSSEGFAQNANVKPQVFATQTNNTQAQVAPVYNNAVQPPQINSANVVEKNTGNIDDNSYNESLDAIGDETPQITLDDFSADGDEEIDRVNSVSYTNMNLKISKGDSISDNIKKTRNKNVINGRLLRREYSFIDSITDEYAVLLRRLELSDAHMAFAMNTKRIINADGSWSILMPRQFSYCLNLDFDKNLQEAVCAYLQKDTKVEINLVDDQSIEGSPIDLCTKFYENFKAQRYSELCNNENFNRLVNELDLDKSSAIFELVEEKANTTV